MILITLAKEDVDDEIRKETFLSVQECNTHTEKKKKSWKQKTYQHRTKFQKLHK